MPDRIPDGALVVRGSINMPNDVRRGIGIHPSGVTGFSVESEIGVAIEILAAAIPNGRIGVTTVASIRLAGGDVIRTGGRSPFHATVIGLTPEAASGLLTPTIRNPAKQ